MLKRKLTEVLDTPNPLSNTVDTYFADCDRSRFDEVERLFWRYIALMIAAWFFVHSAVAAMLLWSGALFFIPVVYGVRVMMARRASHRRD